MITTPAVSREYVHVGIQSTGVTLDTQTIEAAFLPATQAAPDGTTTWLAAEWEGSASTTRQFRILIGPTTTAVLTPGTYKIWSRLTDTTEQPIRMHDTLVIT